MIILGIDPSYTATGYAIIKKTGQQQQLIAYGQLKLPATQTMPERIGLFYNSIISIIQQCQVTHICLETPFLGQNAQTFLKLGYLRGTLQLICFQHKLHIIEFSPREIKQTVTGYGNAPKDQVSRVIHMLFPTLTHQKSFDISDAIAIALCGAWSIK